MKVRISDPRTEDVWIIPDATAVEDDPYMGWTLVFSKDPGAIAFPKHLYRVEVVKENHETIAERAARESIGQPSQHIRFSNSTERDHR